MDGFVRSVLVIAFILYPSICIAQTVEPKVALDASLAAQDSCSATGIPDPGQLSVTDCVTLPHAGVGVFFKTPECCWMDQARTGESDAHCLPRRLPFRSNECAVRDPRYRATRIESNRDKRISDLLQTVGEISYLAFQAAVIKEAPH